MIRNRSLALTSRFNELSKKFHEVLTMKVDQIMTANPTCCSLSDTADKAAGIMREMDVGVVPVVENDQVYKLVGVVTDRDLFLNFVAKYRIPQIRLPASCERWTWG